MLVFGGRAVVAVLSVLALPLVVLASPGVPPRARLLGALFLAGSSVWFQFGSTELPRPVAAVFVMAAFVASQRAGLGAAAIAGGLVGVALCFRFSEVVFLPALMAQFMFEKKYRSIVVAALAAIVTGATILGVIDYVYNGTVFGSARSIVEYTLVERRSSRGYEPLWYYAVELTSWTDWTIVGLATVGAWRNWQAFIWFVIPVVLLSLLPHHEPRYMVPVLPFLAILAGGGLWRMVSDIPGGARHSRLNRRAGLVAVWLILALGGSLAYQLGRDAVPRDDGAVLIARRLGAMRDLRSLAIEEPWRWGSHLYFSSDVSLIEVDGRALESASALVVAITATSPDVVALRSESCARLACDLDLASIGYIAWPTETASGAAPSYRVFRAAALDPR
jgi:hypothetical protein